MHSKTSLLRIDASANTETSSSRKLGDLFINELLQHREDLTLVERNLNQGLHFIDSDWIAASYTDSSQRTEAQEAVLTYSDELIAELQAADHILLTTPMYNFGVPATLKAWIDLICRAGVTFQYTEQGPKGLLKDKQVDIIITTGGVSLGSEVDFVSGYLKQVFAFIGITAVNIIAADGMAIDADASFKRAAEQITQYDAVAA